MSTIRSKKRKLATIVKCLSLPLIIYSIFFIIRINGLQPASESGLGDFITAVNFIFGGSVVYLLFVLCCIKVPSSAIKKEVWWLLSFLMFFLAFDEIFMIHENINAIFGVREIFVFLSYGIILCVLLILNKELLTPVFNVFFILFVFFSGVSVIADSLFTEGVIKILGYEIDYEQIVESFAALSLSFGFVSTAINELSFVDIGE